MITLALPKAPYWLDLPYEVRLKVIPLSTPLYEAARHKSSRLVANLLKDHAQIMLAGGSVEGLPDLDDEDATAGLAQFLFVQALAELSIKAWEGVLGPKGKPAILTPEAIGHLMRFHQISDAFLLAYTKPYMELVTEGNGLRPAQNGTSAAGRPIARRAGNKTSPVQKGKKEQAGPSAPTLKTH